jgi:hypothetical protein
VHVRNSNYIKTPPTVNSNRAAESLLAASTANKQAVLVESFPTGIENTPIVKYMMAGRQYIIVPSDKPITSVVQPGETNITLDVTKPFALVVAPERLDEARQFIGSLANASAVTVKEVQRMDIEGLSHYVFESPGMDTAQSLDSSKKITG